jgi:hypothetical protein
MKKKKKKRKNKITKNQKSKSQLIKSQNQMLSTIKEKLLEKGLYFVTFQSLSYKRKIE